ncbi:MAG: M23 family metallopeptidase [Acidobacteria bacterium]|nr:M23 family metallopeptidase [Acidobacteriota bacterium]
MSQNKHLTIMVFSDELAEHKQFSISRRTIKTAVAGIAFFIVAAVSFGTLWIRAFQDRGDMSALAQENEQLRQANERYLAATMEIETKLRFFDEKTTRLATMVGVTSDAHVTGGLGGATYFDNELGRYLRTDLSLMEQHSTVVEQRLEELDEAFKVQSELLSNTPSLLPARGWLVSGFSYRVDPFTRKRSWHNGLDISCAHGTPIYAPADGVVTETGFHGGFGNLLEINHGSEIVTKYGHLSKFNVSKGQRIKRGDLIGYVGSTGRSTGPHLHYEIHQGDKAIDPLNYIIEEVKPY